MARRGTRKGGGKAGAEEAGGAEGANGAGKEAVVADIVMAIISLVHTAAHYTLLCCRRSLIGAFPLQTLYLIGDE